ncbi:bifunctional [glutamate--ammonia ligase]-adenylyl-L-tyrosine phosphorylase/[glutamate--ammonia-ligase] adenylyltransferase [Geomonas sp. RF6]|uniref:bifunctional [glutamate--ammonia ligase]-adenylyl-L-tyrosine phosphorylase/[glutamate--ammonia-ligase] adenylyltransferase n=1 Tax=Geomonas sp. RF6 TaxID=2897342 RepID=UPI001E4A4EA1|nr:bifunctional [glutamate--ammonia ligase]-adenylyl-L-tyrosine phosphorylase/[glutamate--ammonia-ligase] adenylyltransferase [Geomonas sp. RF6]UFS72785.1 bifunctional [glutamate--ammonia ligase]-adenylyl-L-tyrosine phosphorylase/[glutamate--ammonia-ligase] adenylyltransferase [Geomonas sp. RF6]
MGILAALTGDPKEQWLASRLEDAGFSYGTRSAANLRLLAERLPVELVPDIAYSALAAPLPDMALNGLERVSNAVDPAEFLEVCSRRVPLTQLLNICGSSSFLTNIICRDRAYFSALFIRREIMHSRTEAEMLDALRALVPDDLSYSDLLPLLRRFKYSEMLRIAARDLNGLAPLEEVTAELAALASATLQIAYETSRKELVKEHGAPLMVTEEGTSEADLVVIGMGKLGGRELNFSSDIDIIYLYSSDNGETAGVPGAQGTLAGKISLHAFFVKLGEMISRAISQVTGDGFVFRVDLGLRPEGKSGDLASSLRSMEIYYESWGQSWERAAMIKARPVAGSMALGEQFLRMIEPFIYRRFLDYNLIEDMMGMKLRINASLARLQEGELNVKLGRGGIREIEFFVQALQLVYAGRNKSLRVKNSLQALQKLKESGVVREADCTTLTDAYRFLRMVEHRIQVVQERQTHLLPKKMDELLALSRRCGFLRGDGLQRFSITLEEHRSAVSAIYGDLFHSRDEKIKEEVLPEVFFFFDRNADPELIKAMLAQRRFEHPEPAYQNLLVLRDGPPHQNLTAQGHRTREKIAPLFLQEIFASPDPDLALSNLERFLVAVRSRSSIYALLAENRDILKLLVQLFGMSEFLTKIFISHPELLDSMITRSYAYCTKERDAMAEELIAVIRRAEDFETKLDALRRYRHEEFLRIGMNDINGKMGEGEAGHQLTHLAEVCLSCAVDMARVELSAYGRPTFSDESGITREASFAILAMGKLGGRELNYHSDLDIIYIYDHQGFTDGTRRITNHEYFAKLGQRIILILTTQTREGYVYKIDTRLRPSGNAGPLVTSLESFRDYHRTESQIWERQALTKARVVLGGGVLKEEIEQVISQTVYGSGADDFVRSEIHRLRMRMEVELAKEKAGSYNIKTGRGGMVDVEFLVQYLQLKHGVDEPTLRSCHTLTALSHLNQAGLLSSADYQALSEGYQFLRRLENRIRIIHDYSMNDLGGPPRYLNKLALRLGYSATLQNPGEALISDYTRTTAGIRDVYERILGGAATEAPLS